MQILSSVGSAVGNNSLLHWAQTIKTPHVYGVIEVADDAGIAQTIGMRAVTTVVKHAERPIVSLHDLEAIADDAVREGVQSIALVSSVGTTLYVVARGSGSVYLKRGGSYAQLLHQQGSISGEGKEGDVVLLLSGAVKQNVSESEMMGIFDHLSVGEAAEKFALLLNEQSDSSGCAAVLFEVTKIVVSDSSFQEEQAHVAQQAIPSVFPVSSGRVGRFIRARPKEKIATMKRHAILWGRRMKNPKISVTVLLIILFVGSMLFGIHKELSQKSNQEVVSLMQESTRIYEEGIALMELNPVKGRERLVEAKTLLTPIKEGVTTKTKDGRRVIELYDQINTALTYAMRMYEEEPTLFYDAALLKSGGTIASLGLDEDMVIMADTKEKAVYSMALPNKTGTIIAGGSGYEMTQAVSLRKDTGYVLGPEGISVVSISDKKTTPSVIKKSTDWGTIRSMVSFGGNLYLLDTEKGRIWKYVATDNGFSDIREYLNPDTLPNLSKATSMSIDGSVWIGTMDGMILRFTQGKENTFVPKGVEPAFSSNLVVYTSDVVQNVYVLDTTQKRVVVLDKDGMYISQYGWKGNLSPVNLVVSEKHGKILLLTDGMIYSINLK